MRPFKEPLNHYDTAVRESHSVAFYVKGGKGFRHLPLGFYQGDTIAVKEAWAITTNVNEETEWPGRPHAEIDDGYAVAIWQADGPWTWCDDDGAMTERSYWRSSAIMPRRASRLTLTVETVSVKRAQELTEVECLRAGIRVEPNAAIDLATGNPIPGHRITLPNGFDIGGTLSARRVYADAWSHFHPKHPWSSDPWVVVAACRVHRCNISEMKGAAA